MYRQRYVKRTQLISLAFLLMLLAACGVDLPAGMQRLKNSGLSLYYPDTWVPAQTTENTVLLSNMSGESQSLFLWRPH
jgi:hypothetical protein